MITKTGNCADVHELCISKEEFERKEQRRESIYSGQIYNRRVSSIFSFKQPFWDLSNETLEISMKAFE